MRPHLKPELNLEDFRDIELGRIICYPNPVAEDLEERIEELRLLNVSSIVLGGRLDLHGMSILGKGCSSTLMKAKSRGGIYALKARRVDSDRPSMELEAELLRMANSISVGPKLMDATRNFILMELLEGPFIREWLVGCPGEMELIKVLSLLLTDCFKMDTAGLDHGELTNASRHVIVEEGPKRRCLTGLKPIIIDFESASIGRRPSNVTSICQFLFFSGGDGVTDCLVRGLKRVRLVSALKAYKRRRCREHFDLVLDSSGLTTEQSPGKEMPRRENEHHPFSR